METSALQVKDAHLELLILNYSHRVVQVLKMTMQSSSSCRSPLHLNASLYNTSGGLL